MPTRRIVPRNDGEGSIGKPSKQWGDVQTKKINGTSIAEGGTATTSAVGVVKLATSMETQTGTSTTSAVTPAALKAYTEWRPSGMKNLVINGNALRLINQRGIQNGDVFTPGGWRHTFDLWRMACDCASVEFIKEPDAFGIRILDATGGTFFHPLSQFIEMDEDLVGRTFTITVDFLSNISGADVGCISFRSEANGKGTELLQSSSIKSDSSGTRKKVSVTATAPSGTRSMMIYSSSPMVAGYIKYYNIQLEEGPIATPFEQRPIGLELALCQRYYWKQVGYSLQKYVSGANINSERFPVPMRATPTMVIFSQNDNEAGKIYNGSTSSNVNGSAGPISNDSYAPSVSGGGYSVGDVLRYYVTASAEL